MRRNSPPGRRHAVPGGRTLFRVKRDGERPLTTALGWRLPSWLLDVGPVAFIFVVGAGALAVDHNASGLTRIVLLLGLLASAATLLLRHRWPLIALGVVLVLSLGLGWGPVVALPVLLALFTVAEYSERRQLLVATVVAAVAVLLTDLIHRQQLSLATGVSHLVAIGLAVAVGLYLRARADYITGLRERAERLERERGLRSQQAVAEERVRIARELHDVVAHNVSLMVVQAQALAATGSGDEQRHALNQMADLGRDALSEMHRMLGVLRIQNGSAPERAPQPGVRDLDTLVARTRQAGLDTSLIQEGAPRELPAAVDLSAYRIVQEALTNVIRHAGATHASVTLSYGAEALEVTVLDDGIGYAQSPDHADGGHGLIGMRERVTLFGGNLQTGQVNGGGYRVHAVLPMR
jgi:signal transduction histidine kinase